MESVDWIEVTEGNNFPSITSNNKYYRNFVLLKVDTHVKICRVFHFLGSSRSLGIGELDRIFTGLPDTGVYLPPSLGSFT